MSKVGIVGRREEALCFLAAGFSVYEAHDYASASISLATAEEDDCSIIFLTPEFSQLAVDTEEHFSKKLTPAVVTLPNGDSSGTALLKKYVERAVGADIIFREQ